MVLMGLLRYRTVITFGRRGGPLLVGLTTGAVLVGVVAATQPAELLPAGRATALGAAVIPLAAPAGTPAPAAAALLDPPPTVPAPAPALPTTQPPAPATRATRPTGTRPAPSARPAAPQVSGGQTAQVVALTNRARANAGCAALRVDARLTAAAQGHSDDMSAHRYFAHDSQDGRSFADRITARGYPSPGGENIAQGQPDAQAVVTAWMSSPGHRRNIEDCAFTTIGIGLAGPDKYWTQDFGR